jgi:Fe-S cluster biogenesis protein NfuA
LFVQTEQTPNPDSVKFLPGRAVLGAGAGTRDFPSLLTARTSPLARRLWALDGVNGVFLAADFVTVNKTPQAAWHTLRPQIFGALTEHFLSGEAAVVADEGADKAAQDRVLAEVKPEDRETVEMILELLETRIRPAVQADGGDVAFERYSEGKVFLRLQGSCSTCPSSSATLKGGIERMLLHMIPELTGVEAVPADAPAANGAACAKH